MGTHPGKSRGYVLLQEAERRHVSPSMVGLVFSIYSFASVAASPVLGRMVQLGYIKRRSLLLAGLLVVCISTAMFGFVSEIDHQQLFTAACLFLRAVMGLGCAAVDTAAMALSAALYGGTPFLGTAMGIQESVLSIGWVVGPVVGGYAAQLAGFGAPFFITAALAFACYPALFCLMPRGKEQEAHEEHVEEIAVGRLLKAPQFFLLLISAMLGAAIITALDPTLGPHLEEILGYGPGTIGIAFAVIAGVYAAFTPFAGLLGDYIGRLQVMSIGLLISAASYLLIGPIPLLRPLLGQQMYWLVWVALGGVGIGAGMTFVPSLPALLHAAHTLGFDQEGIDDLVSGILMGSYHSGGGGGPLVGGAAKHLLGFPWSGALFAAILAVQGVVIAILAGVMPPEPKYEDEAPGKLAPITEGVPVTDMEASMPELPPALGTGASGAPFLERVSSTAAAAAPGPAAPTQPIALRRSSSFGARPGSGAGSFKGRSLGRSISRASLLGGPGSRNSSYQDLSNRGVREALLPSEE
ncbi:g11833 [Coccomyxa elongata]